MSKFFRRNPDSSDTSSASSDSEDLEEDSQYSHEDDDLSASRELEIATPPVKNGPSDAVALAGPNKDLLLHALLEEKCLNDVRKEHAGKSTSESAIVIEARNRYQTLSAQLARVGLTAPGLDEDAHQAIRQQYRDGLDVFAKAGTRPGSSAKEIRPSQRRLLTGVDDFSANATNFDNLQITSMASSLPLSLGPYVTQPPLFGSRYTQDFEELGILGKGGYGIVYQCRHKLDGVVYAVKKVPVSESRRQQILLRGQPEIDDLLSELRTLAQLDHPNIVRYFNGWLDYMNIGSPGEVASRNYTNNNKPDVDASESASFAPGRIIAEASDDHHIMFENSTSHDTTTGASTSTSSDHDLRRTTSHATRATVSDEDVESISQNSESNLVTGTDGLQFDMTKPQLAVHMQMALYPMTLTDFLSPDRCPDRAAPPLMHCFHLRPSVRILLAILDGIAYLHQNQIVHRDLKPGNIFLAPSTSSRLADGSVDLSLCNDCDKHGKADLISLKVRIGDFGLVTALATAGEGTSFDEPEAGKSPVGTELYNPPDSVRGTASPALDIYAAGIVAVELLCPFGTRMERHKILHSLKYGRFPTNFNERIGDPDGNLETCVREMLRPDHPPIEELRQRLSAIL